MQLTVEQQECLKKFSESKMVVVYGPGGTGKTTLIQELFRSLKLGDVLIVAFTGSAVHRLFLSGGFSEEYVYTVDSVISSASIAKRFENKVLIVDESSMLSIDKAADLFLRLSPSKVCFVGDPRQLPPVTGGLSILNTLIWVGPVPKIKLTTNHRQTTDQMGLPKLLRRIWNSGKLTKDLLLEHVDDSFELKLFEDLNSVVSWVGKNVHSDSQILAQTNDICKTINDLFPERKKIVCAENYYKNKVLMVPNGLPGVVSGQVVTYSNGFVDTQRKTTYIYANCLTIHKSQGSEYDGVGVILILKNFELSLEQIYTALSRFKKKVILCVLTNIFDMVFENIEFNKTIDREFVKKIFEHKRRQ